MCPVEYGMNQGQGQGHNSGCMQDTVVILVLLYSFQGWPIQRRHLNLPEDDPCCHGNEI